MEEQNTRRLESLAEKGFKEILVNGFRLFTQNYKILILPLGFFQILIVVLNTFLLTNFSWYVDSLGINVMNLLDKLLETGDLTPGEWELISLSLILDILYLFLSNLIMALCITISMCLTSNYLFKKYMYEEPDFTQSIKKAINKKMLLPILIIGVILPMGSFLLFIPSIIIFYLFIFLVFTYNMEGDQKPIKMARAVSKGAFWKVIGVMVIHFLLIFVINFLFQLAISPLVNWIDPNTKNYGLIFLSQILANMINILLAPLFICLLTSLFASLKAKKDLTGIYLQKGLFPMRKKYEDSYSRLVQNSIEETTKEFSSQKMQLEDKFYCPFCGNLVERPKKFCSNCGKEFTFIDK
ncbi:MAG: zinc ribbon domain-containing protein [Promethearchaeota archaeon]